MMSVKYILSFIVTQINAAFHKTLKQTNIKNKSFLKNVALLFLLQIIFISGYGKDNDSKEKMLPGIGDSIKVTGIQSTSISGGYLDTLMIAATLFNNIPKGRKIFVFYIGKDEKLTLHGWDAKGVFQHGFRDSPEIKLINGNPSGVSHGPDTYFGDIVLKRIGHIKKMIKKNKSNFVIFAPEKTGSHIKYKIFVDTGGMMMSAEAAPLVSTEVEANPSPPRNS